LNSLVFFQKPWTGFERGVLNYSIAFEKIQGGKYSIFNDKAAKLFHFRKRFTSGIFDLIISSAADILGFTNY
jgi:hypothetical protein